jgi:hypothetical protein
LPQKSKEYMLSTVYHEILHAYLYSKYPKGADGRFVIPDQHEDMADNYVALMTGASRVAFLNIGAREARALSWGALKKHPSTQRNLLIMTARI